jgi:carboxyl-terminal processing protease
VHYLDSNRIPHYFIALERAPASEAWCGRRFAWLGALAVTVGLAGAALPAAAGSPGEDAEHAASNPAFAKFQRALENIRTLHVEPPDEESLVSSALQGMVRSLDPHSVYLDRAAYRAVQQEMRGTFVGLGIEVVVDESYLRVTHALADAPAYRAGLRSGDLIAAMDGQSVAGMSLEQALLRAHGAADSSIALTVLQPGDDVPKLITVTRAIIAQPTVRARTLESGYLHLRITHFRQNTPELMVSAIVDFFARSPEGVAGMILDLRDNPGGSLRAAVAVSAAFLPRSALVVSMQGPRLGADERLYATGDDYLRGAREDYLERLPAIVKTVPLAVLINGGSASAAEIVAGALQDHGRALLVGAPTYGKGSVQSIVPFEDGTALKLTVARYFTPSGRAIQSRGIQPDVKVEQLSEPPKERTGMTFDTANGDFAETGGTLKAVSTSASQHSGAEADRQLKSALSALKLRTVVR